MLLDAASKKRNALHKAFNWNDREAAHEHRLNEARAMLRCLQVEYEELPERPMKAYDFIRLPPDEEEETDGRRVYRSRVDLLNDPEARELLLEQARKELKTWRDRYRDLSEFAELINSLDYYLEPPEG